LAGSVVVVVYYWLVFIPFGSEGRQLLPARPFAFIVVGVALARGLELVQARRAR
jgi:hypothetical protein